MNLDCPNCDGKLKNGEVKIHGTIGGFFFFGLSYQNLYFKSESEKEIKILGSFGAAPSLRCESCGIVILNKEIIPEEKKNRDILTELLTLCSSEELRESIMESNPEIDIYEQVFKEWNDFYNPQKDVFINSFTEKELDALLEIDDLIKRKAWKSMSLVADRTLNLIINN